MLRTRTIFQKVNTVADFLGVKHDIRFLEHLPVQNESLCLYAILNRGFFAPHPWTFIKDSAKTPAVALATAVTHPRLMVESLQNTEKLIPEVTLAAMISQDITTWDSLPSVYKTHDLRQMYVDLLRKDTKKYYWGLGTIGV